MIRRPTFDDLSAVSVLEARVFPSDEADSLDKITARFDAAPELFWIAVLDGRLVGFVNGLAISSERLDDRFYTTTPPDEVGAEGAAIMSLGVDVEYRRRGIASKLITALLDRTSKKFYVLICKREKIEYYRRFGFEPLGVSEVRLGDDPWFDMILRKN